MALENLKDILGGPEEKKPPKTMKHILHRRTTNGGHVFEHHFTHPEHYPMEDFAHSTSDSAIQHFTDHGTDKAMESVPVEPIQKVE